MTQAILEMKEVVKRIENDGEDQRVIMDSLSLTVKKGEFVVVLGGNGAGKSTLFNLISGNLKPTSGTLQLMGENVIPFSEEKRANYLARVFQDPKMGTAPRMTVSENLLLAMTRGEKRGLTFRKLKQHQPFFLELLSLTGNGLENHLDTPTERLSGGQRQALSLLMATMKNPDLLLLDEHTAALDPKTSKQLMELTNQRVVKNHLTCLMITHHMEDALKYGTRLIVLEKGKIVQDLDAKKKETLQLEDLLQFFK